MINSKNFNGKVVTITGGTGSFGSTFARELCTTNVKSVRIISRDEKKQFDLRRQLDDARFQFFLGDVRDEKSLGPAIAGADYVFHAAALKQVPSCEFFPLEATKTNVFGTANVVEVALASDVESLVVLSTDKAVYPINAMGITKALMEKVALSSWRNSSRETKIMVTRYGNVMGSRGSVIPLFCELLSKGAALPITNPNMTRFMMTLDESVKLVEHAMINGLGGELFVQKAPSATIGHLSRILHKIFKRPLREKFIGERHGEKLYESLLSREEMRVARETKSYFSIPLDDRGLNYENYFDEGRSDPSDNSDYNSHNTEILSDYDLEQKLINLEIVKSYL